MSNSFSGLHLATENPQVAAMVLAHQIAMATRTGAIPGMPSGAELSEYLALFVRAYESITRVVR